MFDHCSVRFDLLYIKLVNCVRTEVVQLNSKTVRKKLPEQRY